jgi:hypothetical protein
VTTSWSIWPAEMPINSSAAAGARSTLRLRFFPSASSKPVSTRTVRALLRITQTK